MEQGEELYSHDSGIGSAMVTHTDSEYKVRYSYIHTILVSHTENYS